MSQISFFLKPQTTSTALKLPSRSRIQCDAVQHKLYQHTAAFWQSCSPPHTSARLKESHVQLLEDRIVGWLVTASRQTFHDTSHTTRTIHHDVVRQRKDDIRQGPAATKRRFGTIAKRRSTTVAVQEDNGLDASYAPYSTAVGHKTTKSQQIIPKRKFVDMVNIYGTPSDLSEHRQRVKQYPLASRLVIPPDKEDVPHHASRVVLEPEDIEHGTRLRAFKQIVQRKLGTVSAEELWAGYQSLRRPQPRYLTNKILYRIFTHLSWVKDRHEQGVMEKVFALLDQCVGEQIPLTEHQWVIAMVFAGRQVRNPETDQVRTAIETWMRMEDSGIQASSIVFHILFDIAVRAGRFALADTIHRELVERGMDLNLYFRSSMIYSAGMRRDGDAVRAAFTDLVNAGELVSTMVLNCVIRSLIRASEGAAAEHVFLKMKALHEEVYPLEPPDAWQDRRLLMKGLNNVASDLRRQRAQHEASFFGGKYADKGRIEEIQRQTPISPDRVTYHLLIAYHAIVSGDIERAMELLRENSERGFPVHGGVYAEIFKGFYLHGGYSFSAWKPKLLEWFWEQFLAAVSPPTADSFKDLTGQDSSESGAEKVARATEVEGPTAEVDKRSKWERSEEVLSELSETVRPPYFDVRLAGRVLQAFYRCCGKKRMMQAWREMTANWPSMKPEERRSLNKLVHEFRNA